ncbi:flagellar hook-associated protein FlgL [Halomonas salinarum]|uniref:flagellar hook-associated protein FlgL n=1 Tax=Halomonas salinarum TaxID=1158993 RepID=UPI00143A5C4C|nr:flagellar hook-associated protein FlgL [Halomonas salinarum]
MRISTVTMFEQSVTSLNRQQSDFTNVGQQIASGRRVVNPSDDPQAASQAVGVSQSLSITEQYTDSRVSARNSLSQEESVLNSASQAISSAKTLLVQAANGTLSDADRQSVASELEGIYNTMLGQANATDGNGSYLFGGSRDDAPPFVQNANGDVTYIGDSNNREQRIDSSRQMPVSDSGDAIFNSVPSGAGYVATAARDAAGDGNVTFSGPSRLDSSAPGYGENAYRIEFVSDSEYQVVTTAPDGTNSTGPVETYTSGESIEVGGGALSITLEGTPDAAGGDSIEINPADGSAGNQDVFATLKSAIDVLKAPVDGDPGRQADLENTIATSMRELDNSLDNVLTVRASVGARLNELDVVDQVSNNRMLSYEQTRSDLVDLDYVEAISEYSLRQVGLQAAQKSFADIQGMSLFDQI